MSTIDSTIDDCAYIDSKGRRYEGLSRDEAQRRFYNDSVIGKGGSIEQYKYTNCVIGFDDEQTKEAHPGGKLHPLPGGYA